MANPFSTTFGIIAATRLGLPQETVLDLEGAAERHASPELSVSDNLAAVRFPRSSQPTSAAADQPQASVPIDAELAAAVTLAAMILEKRGAQLERELIARRGRS